MTARKVGLVVAAVTLAASASAGSAPAAGSTALARLRHAPCPQYEAIDKRSYTPQRQQLALEGRFESNGFRFHLVPPVNWRSEIRHAPARRAQLQRFAWLDALFYVYQHDS